jgi:o-succinylbenzoate---CoA ligase
MNTGTSILDPAVIFLQTVDKTLSYHDLYCHAAGLKLIITDPDSPIGVLTANKETAILLIASAWINGLTVVPFAASSSVTDIAHLIPLSGIKTLICDAGYMNIHAHIDVELLDIKRFGPAPSPAKSLIIDDDKLFGIFFTSGTSGKPKAVPLKRRQMISAARSTALNNQLNPGDLWLHCLPLHHIGGVSIILRSLIYGSGVFSVEGFDVAGIADILSARRGVKAVSLVPTQLSRLIEYPDFKPHEQFRFALIGGGRVPDSLRKKTAGFVPSIFSYGMTETCAQIVASGIDNTVPEGSTGRVLAPNELIICNDQGRQLYHGLSGLICLRGPQVFDGYLTENENTFFPGGWFNTGDYGRTDTIGNLYLESRREDRIVTGGENVDPVEVEMALLQLPGVSDAAVIGLADDEWGQLVTAVIVLAPDITFSLKMLRQELKSRLADYKIPRRLEVIDELPKTDLGKVKKGELISQFDRI